MSNERENIGAAPQQEPVWDGKLSDTMQKALNALYLECSHEVARDVAFHVRRECEAIYTSYITVKRMYHAARDKLEALEASQPQPDPFAAPQPAQAWPIAPDVAADLERSDWTPEEALRWYAAGKHYDTVPNGDGTSSARILDTGEVASNALRAYEQPPSTGVEPGRLLAEHVLGMDFVTDRGLRARELARKVLAQHCTAAPQPAVQQGELIGWIKSNEYDFAKRTGGPINLWFNKYGCDTPLYTRPAAPVAQGDADKRDTREEASIGKAVNRAARDLPEGWEIRIDLERHAGTVHLIAPAGEETMIEGSGELFSDQISAAIDAARSKQEGSAA